MPAPSDYPSTPRPFTRNSRLSEVETRIREFITDNNLQPGQRLPGEEWFAEQLQVGRPLVREALRGMEAVGRIETHRGVGRFVAAFDPEAYLRSYTTEMLLRQFSEREIQETRCLLEITMAADATTRLTDDDLDRIRTYYAALEVAVAEGRIEPESDLGLHRTIMQRSDNRLIVAMLDAVYALAKRPESASHLVNLDGLREDLREHAAIVRAAEARDGAQMKRALIDHFRTTATRLGFERRWNQVFSQPMTEVTRERDEPE